MIIWVTWKATQWLNNPLINWHSAQFSALSSTTLAWLGRSRGTTEKKGFCSPADYQRFACRLDIYNMAENAYFIKFQTTTIYTVEEMTLKTGKYQKRLKKTAKRQKALLFITIGCICIKFRHICPSFDDFWRNSRKLGKESPENTMAGFFKKKIVKQSLLTKFKNLLVLKSILTHFRRD
jgi:hypothetical protein